MKISRRKAIALAAAAPVATVAGAQTATSQRGTPVTRPAKIAVLTFSHETVSYLKYDTVADDFLYEGSPARGEALLASSPEGSIGGFVKAAREYANIQLIGIESPLGSKKGSGSGWITKQAFERFVTKMIAELKAQGPFDGVYMALHGAMAVRDVAKPEAEIAKRVRAVVGPKAYLAGTFDPHGNEDAEFLRHANLAFCIKYYPHYDAYLQGERAARTLIRCIRNDYKPVSATRKPPILSATVLQWTGASPWMDIVQRALVWESRSPDVFVSFYYGFPFQDTVEIGMCFQVVTNGDAELANAVADDMANTAWRLRKELIFGNQYYFTEIHKIKDAVALARKAQAAGKTPIVYADYSDRTGAATWVLQEVIAQGMSDTLFGTIADEGVIEALRKKGVRVGDAFDMEVGGKLDESAGAPVRIKGVINTVSGGITGMRNSSNAAAKSQMWISVKFGNNNVVLISPYLCQIVDPMHFLEADIDPSKFKAIAIKSRVHFRRGFFDNGWAKTILLVEPVPPYLGTTRLEGLPRKSNDVKKFYPFNMNAKYP